MSDNNTMTDEVILQVKGLKTYFHTDEGIVKAVDGITFDLHKGETVGIVGESGSGKSVTNLSIMNLVQTPPGKIEGGEVLFHGEDILKMDDKTVRDIRGNKISMIFQDPMSSLNPFLRISTQMIETIQLHQGLDKVAAREKAIEMLKNATVSVHCWQGDDVIGFDSKEALSGGIQTTGNYPGKARTPEELMADYDKAFSLMPGRKKLNLHACYAIFEDGEIAGRDKIEPKHFSKWVDFAKDRNMGIDFNPTFFAHPMVKDNLTLSSPDEATRKFWVEHGIACVKIAEYFANETGEPCVLNIWIPDGYKDIPADRLSPRLRFKKSLDEILSVPYDKNMVFVTLESKVFGIGLE